MSVYRDAGTSLQAQVRALQMRVQPVERRLTDSLRRHLPRRIVRRLRARQEAARQRGKGADELHRLIRALETYLQALEETLALVPELERSLVALPTTFPELSPHQLLRGQSSPARSDQLMGLVGRLHALVSAFDAEASAEVVHGGTFTMAHLRARFTARRCPFTLLLLPVSQWHLASLLGTSVAPATPPLRVRPERGHHRWLKPLFLRDLEMGHARFDETFLVEAEPEAARLLLDKKVGQALLRLAVHGPPTLVVKRGQATLRWTSPLQEETLAAALRALVAVRTAPVSVRLGEEA